MFHLKFHSALLQYKQLYYCLFVMKEILSNDDKEKSEKYLNIIKADAISEEIYQELYSLIPESFLVEKDRNMPDIQ